MLIVSLWSSKPDNRLGLWGLSGQRVGWRLGCARPPLELSSNLGEE